MLRRQKTCMVEAMPDFDVYLDKGQIEVIPHTECCRKTNALLAGLRVRPLTAGWKGFVNV